MFDSNNFISNIKMPSKPTRQGNQSILTSYLLPQVSAKITLTCLPI